MPPLTGMYTKLFSSFFSQIPNFLYFIAIVFLLHTDLSTSIINHATQPAPPQSRRREKKSQY